MDKVYIEKEAAIETFEQAFDNNWEVSGTLDRIRAIPAADVVEVVRCKDCKYYPSGTDNGEEQGFGLIWPDKEEYKCPFFCDDGWYSRKPRLDFYCSNGTRKDGGQDNG